MKKNGILFLCCAFLLGSLSSCNSKEAPDLTKLKREKTEDTTTVSIRVYEETEPVTTVFEETQKTLSEMTIAVETIAPTIDIVAVTEKTAVPVVFEKKNIAPTTFCIAGQCEPNSKITIRGGVKEVSYLSDDKYFVGTVELPESKEAVTLKITAKTKGKAESDSVTVSGKYNPAITAIRDDDMNVVVGNNYQCHFVSALPDYLGTNLLNEAQMDAVKNRIQKNVEYLDSLGGKELIYVIIPNPMTVYPEWVPDKYSQNVGDSRTKQFISSARKGGATVLDMTELLQNHKKDPLKLFHKTDSHWTEYGAWLAYTELMNYIAKSYPEAAPRTYDEMGFYTKDVNGGDMPYYLEIDATKMRELAVLAKPKFEMPTHIKKFVSENDIMMSHDETPASNDIKSERPALPSALVMRDSFGIALYDMLAERFDETYYQSMWAYDFDRGFIKTLNPDYVIYIVAERNIGSLLF